MNALKKEKKNLCLPGSFLCWVSSGWDSTKFTSFLTSTRSHGLSSEFSVEGSREKGWPFLFGEPRATWSPDPAYTGLMEREFAAINFCLSFFPLPGGPLHIRAVVFAKNTPGWRSMKVPIHAFHRPSVFEALHGRSAPRAELVFHLPGIYHPPRTPWHWESLQLHTSRAQAAGTHERLIYLLWFSKFSPTPVSFS